MRWPWQREEISLPEVPPLEVPDDLDSGTHARMKAEEKLSDLLQEKETSTLSSVLRTLRQENHIRDMLYAAHPGGKR